MDLKKLIDGYCKKCNDPTDCYQKASNGCFERYLRVCQTAALEKIAEVLKKHDGKHGISINNRGN
jgi:hypothetical protein